MTNHVPRGRAYAAHVRRVRQEVQMATPNHDPTARECVRVGLPVDALHDGPCPACREMSALIDLDPDYGPENEGRPMMRAKEMTPAEIRRELGLAIRRANSVRKGSSQDLGVVILSRETAEALAELLKAPKAEPKKPRTDLLKAKCPNCGAPQRAKSLQEGGGVECSERCGWWFCY